MALEIKVLPEAFQAVEELKRHTDLYCVQLLTSQSRWINTQVGSDVDFEFDIQTMVDSDNPKLADEGPYFTAVAVVGLTAFDTDRNECFDATVSYKIQYEMDGQITASVETLNWFAQVVALTDVWPYARELIIGLASKTDILLPPLPMLRFVVAEDASPPVGLRFLEAEKQQAKANRPRKRKQQ